jgi:molybdopterin synthase catalytic subunit
MKTHIIIQRETFDLNEEVAALAQDGRVGAVASFTGHVRAEEDLTSLTLEHYPGMTEAEIGRIAQEAGARWSLTGITVIHRIGPLKPGEAIVLVAAAAPHRTEAFKACEFLMDWLKTRAPFWKQETRGGRTGWVEARSSDKAAAMRWQD